MGGQRERCMRFFLADDEMWITIGLRKLIERSGLPFRVIGEANDGITALEEIGKNLRMWYLPIYGCPG